MHVQTLRCASEGRTRIVVVVVVAAAVVVLVKSGRGAGFCLER